jgi:hypothetical protein
MKTLFIALFACLLTGQCYGDSQAEKNKRAIEARHKADAEQRAKDLPEWQKSEAQKEKERKEAEKHKATPSEVKWRKNTGKR